MTFDNGSSSLVSQLCNLSEHTNMVCKSELK